MAPCQGGQPAPRSRLSVRGSQPGLRDLSGREGCGPRSARISARPLRHLPHGGPPFRFRYHVLTLSTLYFVVVRGCKQGRHIVAPSRARAGRRDGKHSLPAVCLPPCSSAPDALSGPRQKILFAALLRRDGYPALLSRCSCLSLQVPLAATSGCRHSTDMILRPPNHHPSAEAISEAVGRLRRPCILCAKTSLFQQHQ